MSYAEDILDDRMVHRKYHDEIVNGIPARQMKSDNTIWQNGDDRIIVVNAFSPRAQRVRAERVGRVANNEMPYDGSIYSACEQPDDREIHLFIYLSRNRAVGLSIIEKRSEICHYTWDEYDQHIQKELVEKESIWSLGFTWVHKKHRRYSVAKILLLEATRYLEVCIKDVGVYTPFSEDGEAFTRAIFSDGFLIAK